MELAKAFCIPVTYDGSENMTGGEATNSGSGGVKEVGTSV